MEIEINYKIIRSSFPPAPDDERLRLPPYWTDHMGEVERNGNSCKFRFDAFVGKLAIPPIIDFRASELSQGRQAGQGDDDRPEWMERDYIL